MFKEINLKLFFFKKNLETARITEHMLKKIKWNF